MIITQYIPDLVGEVVGRTSDALDMDITYEFGHYRVVENDLINRDSAITDSARKKFPLIWLVMDFEETMGKLGLYSQLNLNMILATGTQVDYTMEERRDITFLPILYPMYSELLYQFSINRNFVAASDEQIEHTKIDRPYWGIQGALGNGERNMFSDFVDAIQLKNLRLSLKRKDC